MVFRFWASLSLLVLACACRHNLICSLWAKGQLQIQGAIDESTWIKAETLNGKGSKNEPSVGLNSAYIMLHLSCRATEWIRRKRLCRPRQRRCIRKVPATERFDGSWWLWIPIIHVPLDAESLCDFLIFIEIMEIEAALQLEVVGNLGITSNYLNISE